MSAVTDTKKPQDISAFKERVSQVMLRDRRSLASRIKHLEKDPSKHRQIRKLHRDLQASEVKAKQRLHRFQQVAVKIDLPIADKAQDIVDSIRDNQVTVIAGATGSGKTTQIPKLCLQAGYGVCGNIGHTQPRRIAARATATRIAEELNTSVGDGVGCKVRFSDQTGPDCQVKLLTDGMLLQEAHSDRALMEYDCIIIDEAHERSLNIDFLLGILKKILTKRPKLRLVITSATINPHEFSAYFDDAPIIEVEGRTYPVDFEYRGEDDLSLDQKVGAAIESLWEQHGREDVLVFLPGERAIRETLQLLHQQYPADVELHPLFARLPVEKQQAILKPGKKTRIILATNVAETSLTVPGIVYVVDSGLARISRYHYKSKLQRLAIEKISQASAAQRAGRCGRTQPGICVRLYSEEDLEARRIYTDPEILRTSLASVILRMSVLGLGKIRQFPFLDRPDSRFINDGFRLLTQLEAVSTDGKVSESGKKIARFPLDPRLGKILIEAVEDGCLREIQILAAGLSAGDPRERPWDKQQAADQVHLRFVNEESDFLTLLNIWQCWEELGSSENKRRKWCRKNYMAYRRMKEWQDVLSQLQRLTKELGHLPNTRPVASPQLHTTLLKGFADNVCERKTEQRYIGARGREIQIFPGSGLVKKRPRWITAAEVVHTSKVFARCVAKIQPGWIENAVPHLTKRRCIDEFWSRERACPMGVEEITLFGFVLNRNRRVHLAKHSEAEARKRFIQHALVENNWRYKDEFVLKNEDLRKQVRKNEAKLRRLMLDEDRQFDFFYQKLPEKIYDRRSFTKWWKKISKNNPSYLDLTVEDAGGDKKPRSAWYPDFMNVSGQQVKLQYVFDPERRRDGVTLALPSSLLAYVKTEQSEWLIPGWLQDKAEFLLRGLPKDFRKKIMPIGDRAREFVIWAIEEQLPGGTESLRDALSRFVQEKHEVTIPAETWPFDALPDWMRLGVAVLDEDGKEWVWGRDLKTVRQQAQGNASLVLSSPESEWLQADLTEWSFGDLPDTVTVTQDGMKITACPALVDKKYRVDMELLPTMAEAVLVHGEGVLRLIARTLRSKVNYLKKNLPDINRLSILYLQIGEFERLFDDLVMASLSRLIKDAAAIRTDSDYAEKLVYCRTEIINEAQDLAALTLDILSQRQRIFMIMDEQKARIGEASFDDIQRQVNDLIYDGFVKEIPARWFSEIPRYLQAVEKRLEKIIRAGKEPPEARTLAQHSDVWRTMTDKQLRDKPDYRWMVEEWRVSIFAQELGTCMPVSEKRIQKYLAEPVEQE